MTGLQAVAHLPVAQQLADRGAGFNTASLLAGSEGPPLVGFEQELTWALQQVPDLPILARPGLGEDLAATAVMGTQLVSTQRDAHYEGIVGYWYGQGAGLGRSGDAMRHANFAGTSRYGGAVALVGDDADGLGSTLPSTSDLTLIDLNIATFAPGDVQEILDLARHAVALSRLSGLWTALKLVSPVVRSLGTVDLALDRVEIVEPNLEVDGLLHAPVVAGSMAGTVSSALEQEIREVRIEVARRYGVVNKLNHQVGSGSDGWIGLIAPGTVYPQVLRALQRLGFDSPAAIEAGGIRLLRLGMPFPLDGRVIRKFARGLRELVVIEEKNPSIEWMVKDALYGSSVQPLVVGRSDEAGATLFPSHGSLDAEALAPVLRRRLAAKLADRLAPEQPVGEVPVGEVDLRRPPGQTDARCPRRLEADHPTGDGYHRMAKADAERAPDLGLRHPPGADPSGELVGTTAAGSAGSQWIGMEPFLEYGYFVQHLHHSTLLQSGQPALRSAIAAGSSLTYRLAYEGEVAVGGGQDSSGGMGMRELIRLLLTQGVTEVLVVSDNPEQYDRVDLPTSKYAGETKVWGRARMADAGKYLSTVPRVSVLIDEQGTTDSSRRARRRAKALSALEAKLVINHRLCEACGDCGEARNCHSVRPIDTPFGVKTAIVQSAGKPDPSCLEGDCPSFMVVEPRHRPRLRRRGRASTEAAVQRSSADPTVGEGWLSAQTHFDLPDPPNEQASDDRRVSLRLVGLDRAGLRNAVLILGAAAANDGWLVSGLDHSASSGEGGPAACDLSLSRDHPGGSGRPFGSGTDVVIALHPAAAVSTLAIDAYSEGTAVLISAIAPAGSGAVDSAPISEGASLLELEHWWASVARSERNRLVDADQIAPGFLSDSAQATMFLFGMAVQSGELPLSIGAVERALDENFRDTDAVRSAFAWGRQWVDDPDQLSSVGGRLSSRSIDADVPQPVLPSHLEERLIDLRLDDELHALFKLLTADLVGYQNAAYAGRFVDFMTRVVGAERLQREGSTTLSAAVAMSLHKLMAYKDEYEVARLLRAPEVRAAAVAFGGRGSKVRWKLQPPTLTARGLSRKVSVNARWGRPLLGLLCRGKRLRGTALDPFGGTELRRAEKSLADEYSEVIEQALEGLSSDNFDATVELARSALEVRGYGTLKLSRIAQFRSRLAQGVPAHARST